MHPNTPAPRRAFAALALAGLAIAAPQAQAQAINIDIANPTLTPGETTIITLTASYPDGDYAVAGIFTDLVANVIHGGLSDPSLIAPMAGPGTSVGAVGPGGITGIIAGQLNFPPAFIFADPTNPIAFYQFDFTWDGSTTGGYILDIETDTSRFDTYVDRDSSLSVSRLDGLREGRAVIFIPAPAGAAAFGLLALGAATRRRR